MVTCSSWSGTVSPGMRLFWKLGLHLLCELFLVTAQGPLFDVWAFHVAASHTWSTGSRLAGFSSCEERLGLTAPRHVNLPRPGTEIGVPCIGRLSPSQFIKHNKCTYCSHVTRTFFHKVIEECL